MAERTIEVQKQLGEKSGGLFGGGSGGAPPREGASKKEAAASKPLAGFWNRALAALIDLVLLYVLAKIWFPLSKEFFLDHPTLLTPTAVFIVILYSTILNGPLGKGQTVGKLVTRIVTRRLDGRPLTWGEAAGRASIQCAPLLTQGASRLVMLGTEPGSSEAGASTAITTLLVIPGMVFLMFNTFMVGARPDKRVVHDLFARSFTFKVDAAGAAHGYLAAIPLVALRRSWRLLAFTGGALLILFEYNAIHYMRRERATVPFLDELWAANGLPGWHFYTPLSGSLTSLTASGVYSRLMSGGAVGDDAPTSGGPVSRTGAAASAAHTSAPLAQSTASSPSRENASKGPTEYFYPIAYIYYGRADEEALRRTIEEEWLTTGVVRWLEDRWRGDDVPEPMLELRDALTSGNATCERAFTHFVEILSLPKYLGPSHHRILYSAEFPFDLGGGPEGEGGPSSGRDRFIER